MSSCIGQAADNCLFSRGFTIHSAGQTNCLTISMGVATIYPNQTTSWSSLFRKYWCSPYYPRLGWCHLSSCRHFSSAHTDNTLGVNFQFLPDGESVGTNCNGDPNLTVTIPPVRRCSNTKEKKGMKSLIIWNIRLICESKKAGLLEDKEASVEEIFSRETAQSVIVLG